VHIGKAVFHVKDYGAIGDGHTDDTSAIQQAIDACVSSGGMVKFEKGNTYFSRSFQMKGSNCALYLPQTSVVKFDDNPSSYDHSSHLIEIEGSNVAIIGGGVFNGQGKKWWDGKICTKKEITHAIITRRKDDSCWRPRFLSVSDSSHVLIQGVTWKDSPDHVLEMYSDYTEIDHVTVLAPPSESTVAVAGTTGPSHNTDAVDVHGTPFYIHDCHFDTGDDNVAVHSSHLLVENCHFGHGHGTSIGSCDSDTALENITFRNIVYNSTTAAMRIKTRPGAKRSYVRDCIWENLSLYDVRTTVLIDMFYDHGHNETTDFDISNIVVRNATVHGSVNPETGKDITPGFLNCQETSPCHNIQLHNIHHLDRQEPFECSNAYGSWSNVDPPPCLKPEWKYEELYGQNGKLSTKCDGGVCDSRSSKVPSGELERLEHGLNHMKPSDVVNVLKKALKDDVAMQHVAALFPASTMSSRKLSP
jgi:polygalacturonase